MKSKTNKQTKKYNSEEKRVCGSTHYNINVQNIVTVFCKCF